MPTSFRDAPAQSRPMAAIGVIALAAAAAAAGGGGGALASATSAAAMGSPSSHEPWQEPECIKGGGGSLKLSLTGAHDYDLDWPNEGTVCHGAGTRYGVGVNFGRTIAERATLTVGFTIKQLAEGETGEDFPVDVSIGGNAVNDNVFKAPAGACRVDITEHALVEDAAGTQVYRVSGHGSCNAPAAAYVGDEEITISDFQFSGMTNWPK